MSQDFFDEVRHGYWSHYLTREHAVIASEYTSPDMLDFATRMGSKAIRLGDVAGSIEVGKRADLVLLRTDRFGFAPQGTLADRVVNFAGQEDVDSVWVAGRRLKSDGKLVGVDWKSLAQKRNAIVTRISEQVETIKFT